MTKHQRRNFGTIWTQLSTNRLDISGSVTTGYLTSSLTNVDNFSFSVNNTDQISRSFPELCVTVPGTGDICEQFYSGVRSAHGGRSLANDEIGSCDITLPF